MTLPFDNSNKDKRKYQCFVCGIMFQDFDLFKTHILESHEEGREYVICSLERCKAPVRDMRMHFKAKHPHETIPKKGQMKAMIWKDHKKKGGKPRTRKPVFREGFFTSKKMGGKEMHYRSGYECDVYECLELITEVIAYDVEPFKVPYSHKGKQRKYTPDLSVKFHDGRIEIWEIKPASQTMLDVNHSKWTACNDYCKNRGWEFVVMTEVGIGKLKRKIKRTRH
jgi:hypothetical protein